MRLVAVRRDDVPFAHRLDLGERRARLGRPPAHGRRDGAAPGVRSLKSVMFVAALMSLTACASAADMGTASAASGDTTPVSDTAAVDQRVVFPAVVSQGALVFGKVPAGSLVRYAGRVLRPTPYGTVVFGIGRDESGPVLVDVQRADGSSESASIAVTPRDWPIERID